MKQLNHSDQAYINFIPKYLQKLPVTNPLELTQHSKTFFKQHHFSTMQEIEEARKQNVPLIHIRNFYKKSFDVSTPYSGQVDPEGLNELIYYMYGVIGAINTFPILYQDEDESIIRAVAPRFGSHNENSSQSPYNDLDWHMDAAYRPMMDKDNLSPAPDYLIFGVVHKGHEHLPIIYISLAEILKQLSDEEILMGLAPEFTVTSPDSFANKNLSENIPLLVQNEAGEFYSRITLQNAKPLTQKAGDFLRRVREIANQPHLQNIVNVEAGDVIILNNKTTLHKRDSFKPKWDGKDRYFLRIYSTKDLNQGILTDSTKPWSWK